MNKKQLYLIEFDENGNEIDRNLIVDTKSLLTITGDDYQHNLIPSKYLIDKKDKDIFTGEQWSIMEETCESIINIELKEDVFGKNIIRRRNHLINVFLDEKLMQVWKYFFNQNKEMQEFVLNNMLVDCYDRSPQFWKIPIKGNRALDYNGNSLDSCINWIESRTGIYYAVNNSGVKEWDFVDCPTLKQARYQRKKGRRIIFLSFENWKEYLVKEEELS